MKDITAICEKDFVQKLILSEKRLDGRNSEESREVKISFGSDRGCVLVSLGNTCVLSQVSCELAEPRSSRPSEGQLHVNVELSQMAAPNIEANRSSEISISGENSRLLERCIRDSRCIDLESLCVVSGEKVWNIRVDIHVLNHAGNISECGSIAAVTALAHFRRPDVTVLGADVTVHTVEERDPVPLSLLHMPFCTTIGIFNDGVNLVIDPTDLEERVSMGMIVIGLNTHQEVCMLHLGGKANISKERILSATNMAFRRVQKINEIVRESLSGDATARSSGKKVGFAQILQSEQLLRTRFIPKTTSEEIECNLQGLEISQITEDAPNKMEEIFIQAKGAALIGQGGPSAWDTLDMDELDEETSKIKDGDKTDTILSDSSEEEETMTLKVDQTDSSGTEAKLGRDWYKKMPF